VLLDRDVLFGDRRQANTPVVVGVLLASDPEQADVQQPDRAREHPRRVELVAL
jgi:hypothetical protein